MGEQQAAACCFFVVVVTGGIGIAELRINGYIRAPEVRLVAPDGSQIGVKKLAEALWLADQLGLDLVEVAPDAKPPVCRLMDYGKFKYEQSIRDREARKHQKRTVIKELRMAPRIETHDFDITLRRALEFLDEGDKVKVTVRFRGREQERPEFGKRLLDRLAEGIGEAGTIEQTPQLEGRMMTMVLAPSRRRRKVEANHDEQQPSNEEPNNAEDENS
ncbi:MAG TPA: translation initiation factor IF-3 [Acidimicrobiia bacterium]|nr:translation initiation factor IF-3 [Acidimicrobiia bacterium]